MAMTTGVTEPETRRDRRRATRRASPGGAPPVALAWLDDAAVTAVPTPDPAADAAGPLVSSWPRAPFWRPATVTPIVTIGALVAAYAGTTLFWPLHEVTPAIAASTVEVAPGPASALAWPTSGGAAVSVTGFDPPLSSTGDALSMASIAKVISTMVVLEEMPLALGETGPEFYFPTQTKWDYLANDESALDVPVGGYLSQYQLLEGTLIGSAGNYIDRLVYSLYPNDAIYAEAAARWLEAHGIEGITVVDPSGHNPEGTAPPEALIRLARVAMANPVFAEIVGKEGTELPGTGWVENTNAVLGDPGVVGVKTGMLNGYYNLLSTKDIEVAGATVRVYTVVQGQPNDDARWNETRMLFDTVAEELTPTVAVPAGTVVGQVTTQWGEPIEVRSLEDASLVLWNASPASAEVELTLGDARAEGTEVGTMTVAGPLGTTTVPVALAEDVEGPGAWWRLTHPAQLWGIDG